MLTAWAELADELGDDETAGRLRGRATTLWAERAAALIPELETTPVAREADPDAAPLEDILDPDLAPADDQPGGDRARGARGGARPVRHDSLRPGQAEVIAQALSGVDTLATMPTGAASRSAIRCRLLLRGATVVVSPLIALMKDQVDVAAARRGRGHHPDQ